MSDRYQFTNWTQELFVGRYGGQNFPFAVGESKEFDPDKHYQLILMAKQLADREIMKGIRSVGRNPNDEETWAKSLDVNGKPFVITVDLRKSLMRKAIGELVDKPIPIPEETQSPEAGQTQEASADVKTLQDQVAHLTELVQSLAAAKAEPVTPEPVEFTPAIETPAAAESSMSTTREVLYEMAVEQGLPVHEGSTKEEILELLNTPRKAPAQ